MGYDYTSSKTIKQAFKKMLKLLLFLPPKHLQTDINVISFTLAT